MYSYHICSLDRCYVDMNGQDIRLFDNRRESGKEIKLQNRISTVKNVKIYENWNLKKIHKLKKLHLKLLDFNKIFVKNSNQNIFFCLYYLKNKLINMKNQVGKVILLKFLIVIKMKK